MFKIDSWFTIKKWLLRALCLIMLGYFFLQLHALPPIHPPEFMSVRDTGLLAAFAGYKETGVSLVAKTEPLAIYSCHGFNGYIPAGLTDDPGLYYFITKINFLCNLDLLAAKTAFIEICRILTIVIMSLGMILLFRKNLLVMLLAVVGTFALSLFAFTITTEVYVAPLLVIAFVPLILYAYKLLREPVSKKIYIAYGILSIAGIFVSIANFIRSHAGTGLILFLVLLLLLQFNKLRWRKIVLALCAFFIGLILAKGYFYYLEDQRDQYLVQQGSSSQTSFHVEHPFWHNFYIGLGYLPNSYGLEWNDSVSYRKVQSIDAKVCYLSTRYEQILRSECISFIVAHPMFVVRTYVSKAIISLRYIFREENIFYNWWIGLFLLCFARTSLKTWPPFLALSGFYLLNGIIAQPTANYILGAAISMQLLALYGICEFLYKHLESRHKNADPLNPRQSYILK